LVPLPRKRADDVGSKFEVEERYFDSEPVEVREHEGKGAPEIAFTENSPPEVQSA
jgi:hypothetical protein